jgi:hypothetical protein
LGHTSCPLVDLSIPFWVHLWVPKWEKKHRKTRIKKTVFWLVRAISPKRIGLMIWLAAFFVVVSLDIGPYIPLTHGPFWTLLGRFGGAPMTLIKTKKALKTTFRVVLDHFSYWNGRNDLVWSLSLSLDNETKTSRPLACLCIPFRLIWGCPNGPIMAKDCRKKLFSGCFEPILLKVRA